VDPTKAKLIRKLIAGTPCALHQKVERGCGECTLIVDIDYKNLELFIAWHYSGDQNLARALTELDFHTTTASAIFTKPYDLVTGGDRFQSKFVTFGIAYGRQAWSLAEGELKAITGGDPAKAQEYIDRFWNLYPDYHRVYEEWKWKATNEGELRTPLGRVRRWRLIMPSMLNHINNQAVNFPIQSLASDTCLGALIKLNHILPERGWGKVLFTVHDSLVFEIKAKYLHVAMPVIVDEMTHPTYETEVQFKVDIEVGPSLGEVEPYDREMEYA
jgi:DNA polymerase-1